MYNQYIDTIGCLRLKSVNARRLERLFIGCFKGCFTFAIIVILVNFIVNILVLGVPLYRAYNQWQASKPDSYSLTVNYGTSVHVYSTVNETVSNGIVTSDRSSASSTSTIDSLFDEIKAYVFYPIGFLLLQVEYDEEYGYPQRIDENDFDLGRVTQIVDFKPETD